MNRAVPRAGRAVARQRDGRARQRHLLILGLGNVICGDDGLGVAAVERLAREFELPETVEALDGGTLGLSLLAHVTGADDLLLLDAVRADAPAGTFISLSGDDVAPAVRERLSVYQIGVADLLDALRLLDEVPRRMVLLGLVPETLDLGLGLSPAVAAGLDELVAAAVHEAVALGYSPFVPRRRPADAPLLPRGDRRAHRALGL